MAHQYLQELKTHFLNNLDQLKEELKAFPDESLLWETPDGISNSAGNLGLHIAGNLQHFFGHVIGKTSYIRNRPFEFEAKDIGLSAILIELGEAKKVVEMVLDNLEESTLSDEFPIEFSHQKSTVYFNLLRFGFHLSYHLGQVNYLRRMLVG